MILEKLRAIHETLKMFGYDADAIFIISGVILFFGAVCLCVYAINYGGHESN